MNYLLFKIEHDFGDVGRETLDYEHDYASVEQEPTDYECDSTNVDLNTRKVELEGWGSRHDSWDVGFAFNDFAFRTKQIHLNKLASKISKVWQIYLIGMAP